MSCSHSPTTGGGTRASMPRWKGPGRRTTCSRPRTSTGWPARGVLFRHAFVERPVVHSLPERLALGPAFLEDRTRRDPQRSRVGPVDPDLPSPDGEVGVPPGRDVQGLEPRHARRRALRSASERLREEGRRFNQFSQVVSRQVADGKPLEEAKQELYDEVSANFDDFLADRKPGQPFCYWFGPTNVHRKWVKGSGKALWGIDPDDLKGKMPRVPA